MRPRMLSIAFHVLLRIITFVIAAVNFTYIWSNREIQDGRTFVEYTPWYNSWSPFYEPSVLLFASILILTNKYWSYVTAAVLSGYILLHVFLSLMTMRMSFSEFWNGIHIYQSSVFLTWELQGIPALVIFCVSLFHLVNAHFVKNTRIGK